MWRTGCSSTGTAPSSSATNPGSIKKKDVRNPGHPGLSASPQGSERQRRRPIVARIRQRTRNLIRAFCSSRAGRGRRLPLGFALLPPRAPLREMAGEVISTRCLASFFSFVRFAWSCAGNMRSWRSSSCSLRRSSSAVFCKRTSSAVNRFDRAGEGRDMGYFAAEKMDKIQTRRPIAPSTWIGRVNAKPLFSQ